MCIGDFPNFEIVDKSTVLFHEYIGCFWDMPDRIFPYRVQPGFGYKTPNALDFCREKCDEAGKGFDHYGLQFSTECYCGYGHQYNKYGPKSESECQRECTDAAVGTKCGGGWAMSVYKFRNN